MSNTPKTVLFYGLSGAGKGTQATLLSSYLELEAPMQRSVLYLETGASLRGFVAGDSGYTSRLTREQMEKGVLLPTFMPVYIWANTLVEQFTGEEHLILDGLARRIAEVPILDSALSFYSRDDYDIIVLEISDDEARERLVKRGRADDAASMQNIENKIAWFKENALPCVDEFEKMGKRVHRINGTGAVEDIHTEVRAALGL